MVLAGLTSLTVTLLDGGGRPVSGAQVMVSQIGRAIGAATDATGAARFPTLPAGPVNVTARDSAAELQASSFLEILPAVPAAVSLALPEVGAIAGRVLQPDGITPAPDIEVKLYEDGGSFVRSLVSGADGWRVPR